MHVDAGYLDGPGDVAADRDQPGVHGARHERRDDVSTLDLAVGALGADSALTTLTLAYVVHRVSPWPRPPAPPRPRKATADEIAATLPGGPQ
jgi:hypothetical protein